MSQRKDVRPSKKVRLDVPPEDGFPPEDIVGGNWYKVPRVREIPRLDMSRIARSPAFQHYRCESCAKRDTDCLQFPMRGRSQRCFDCARRCVKCSHSSIIGTGGVHLRAYRLWRSLRIAANPNIYTNPVVVSNKWSKKKDQDVPTWFVDLYENINASQSVPCGIDWSAAQPKCEDFPRAPSRPQVALDDVELCGLTDAANAIVSGPGVRMHFTLLNVFLP